MEKKLTARPLLPFFAVMILYNLAANFAHPVTPTLIKVYQLGDYMFGVAFAAMMTANFLFSPFWGKLNGYISSRKSMLICCTGYSIGQLLFFFAHTEFLIVLARLVAGVFTGGVMVSFLTYLVNVSSQQQRGRNLTIQATIASVAGAFGYFIGGFLGEISLAAAFLSQVACLFASGILFYIVCGDDRVASQEPLAPRALVRQANPFAAFVASRKFMTTLFALLFAVTALQNLSFTAFDQCFNFFIKDQYGFTSAYNGAIKGVIGLISLVANSTICLWIIRKTDVNRSVPWVLLACAATNWVLVFTGAKIPFLLINIVYFAFNAISIPLLQDMVARKAQGGDSNLIMGFYNATKSLGGIIGSLVAGFVYAYGARLSFVFAGAVMLCATLFALAYWRRQKSAEKA